MNSADDVFKDNRLDRTRQTSSLGPCATGRTVEKGDWLRAIIRFYRTFRVAARCLSPFSTRCRFREFSAGGVVSRRVRGW